MVYTTGGELRTFVQVAAVCALAISSFRVQASDIDSATGSSGDVLLEKCGISDGDKAFGIQVVTDFTCALGGLGCYNDHCRYCKLADTLKSAHFESCESLGASFPTMAPLTISSGPCQVSSGDAAVGVGAMTDPTCLYGGIGCFSDHCRFCQSAPTLQSSHFLPCSWTEGSSSTSGSDSSPVGYTTKGAPVSLLVNGASTSGRRKEAIEAGSASSCTMTVSDGDAAVGISITTDATCVSGGNGCIDSICRFCKVKDTPQSAHFNACPTADNSKVCTTTVSAGDAATGINIVTDATCAQGGLGCIDSVCRFCRATATASSSFLDCALVGSSPSTTQAPVVTTPVPITTIAPVTTAPVPTSTPTSTTTRLTCSQTVSDGDAAVGIKIVTDTSCSTGGVGCIDQVCRFCRVTTTAQSASFVECTTIQGTTTAATTTPTPNTSPPTTAPPTKTPAPTTAAPAKTPTLTPSTAVCTMTAAAGDISVGINIVTDITCVSGGLGCIDTLCRFCKTKTTTQSASYPDCATIAGTSTQAPAVTATPTSKPPATTTSTPAIVFDCFRTVSSGDKGVGLDIVSDIRCSEGGTGCLDEVCRFCKRFDTVQSQTYLDCTSIPSADIGSDITFVPIPVVDDSETATRMLVLDAYESDAASGCSMAVSAGDAAAGINIVTDTSCSSGGTGCIDTVCRYCKTKDTVQSAHFNSCPVTTTSGTVSTKVCAITVSGGDAAVGINIITDTSCANGGLGCIDSICRYCKTRSTDQSAHFGSCSDYLLAATTSPVTASPVATAAPTNAPVSTTSTYSIPLDCYQTASDGDKNLGLDIVTDIRCGDGGVGCVDSACRFCKHFDTPQSRSYMNCSDIPSSDNGADINFQAIAVIDDTQETLAETIVAVRESTELTTEPDETCANVVLADGEAAGGIGVVLDTEHCPSGLASGCIGDSGCRYCMRFPTNVSNYLEYCTIANSTDVVYALSGLSPSVGDSSTIPTNAGTGGSLSDEEGSAIAVETRASKASIPKLFESATIQWVAVAAVCIGAVAIVGLAVFGIKRTIGSLTSSNARKSDQEKVIPDDENRPSVLITSNVGEPGVIRDV